MGLGRRRILETSLFDLERVVTVQYLSRHADIPIDDARDELNDFLMENKDRTKLYAVYILSGELKAPDTSEGGNGVPTCKIRRTQLVRDYDLEKFRKDYSEVYTCEIYCLNTRPIKSLCLLYSADSLDDAEYVRTDPERSWLLCPEALVKEAEFFAKLKANAVAKTNEEEVVEKEVVASTSETSEPVPKKKKSDLASMFAQAASQAKPKQSSAKENGSQAAESAGQKTTTASCCQTTKRRGQRILVDNEEPDVKMETGTEEILERKDAKKKSQETGPSKNKKTKKDTTVERPSFFTQKDLFSDGASSPEEMEVDETEGTEAQEKEPPKELRPSACVLNVAKVGGMENDDGAQQSEGKVTRKERVTETFMDSDGFMVTKEVLKEIEVKESPSSNVHNEKQKNIIGDVKLIEKKTRKNAKVPQGQAKISSFFQKI